MDPRGLIVERHRYGLQGPAVNLQDRMQSLSVNRDILGKEDTQMAMLGPYGDATTEFVPGDFMVLRTKAYDTPSAPQASGDTWGWGRVSAVRSKVARNPNGRLTHAPYTVLCQGWYDMMARAKVHVFETRNVPTVGTAFRLPDWMSIAATLQGMYGQDSGAMLEYTLKQLVRIRLPESLGGGWLGDEVRIVHNEETARKYAREFMGIESVSFGRLMPHMVQRFGEQRSTDVGSLINGMFVPEPMLIEIFPYLSAGGEVAQTTSPPFIGPQSTVYAEPMTKLGQILGRQPVLVYRIKPFRADPLWSSTVSKIAYSSENIEVGYLVDSQTVLYSPAEKQRLDAYRKESRRKSTILLKQDGMFSQQTFNSADCVPLPWDYVTSLSRQRTDSERVNASTIHVAPPDDSPQAIVSALDGLALPITIDNQIEQHGLRLRISHWPFFTPVTASSQDLSVFYRTVAAQIMQFYQNAHLFDFGSITTHFANALKISEDRTGASSARTNAVRLIPDLEPGRWFRTSFDGEYFGYITSIAHSIQRTTAGNLTANTVLNYMRGHSAEMWDVLNGAVVPLGEMDLPPAPPAGGAGAGAVLTGGSGSQSNAPASAPTNSSVTVDPRCNIYFSSIPALAAFNQGTAASSFADAPSLAQRPLWLKCWMIEALSMNSRDSKRVHNALAAVGADAQYANNVWALAACCYVIERYWKAKYPQSRIRIASIPRVNDGFHDVFAAADFYLDVGTGHQGPRPGALQMWGALYKLVEAGRIPEGGHGVYLNVNPQTGIQGVLPEQAGRGTSALYPPGGSSFTHYDIAGSFGGISRPGRSGPFAWLSVDWIGKGKDQLTRISKPYEEHVAAINRSTNALQKKQRLDNLETGGTPSDLDDVLAGIADPGLIRLSRLSKATPTPKRVSELLGLRAAQFNIAIAAGRDPETERVPLRDAVKEYFNSRGKNDTSLHAVGTTVPNAIQVLNGLGQTVQAGGAAVSSSQPVQVASALQYGKFTAAPTSPAPFIAVYGGTAVQGIESGTYMYDYLTPRVTAKNNVYVAATHRVPGVQSYDEGFDQMTTFPAKRILYMFSGGELPCRKIYEKYSPLIDKVYLVDPYFAQSVSKWAGFISSNPSKFVFVYTPIPTNGPTRRGQATPSPTNTENGMDQTQLNLILAYQAQGMKVIEVPLLTPTPTAQQLLERHMFTNEKAIDDMVQSRIILV